MMNIGNVGTFNRNAVAFRGNSKELNLGKVNIHKGTCLSKQMYTVRPKSGKASLLALFGVALIALFSYGNKRHEQKIAYNQYVTDSLNLAHIREEQKTVDLSGIDSIYKTARENPEKATRGANLDGAHFIDTEYLEYRKQAYKDYSAGKISYKEYKKIVEKPYITD